MLNLNDLRVELRQSKARDLLLVAALDRAAQQSG